MVISYNLRMRKTISYLIIIVITLVAAFKINNNFVDDFKKSLSNAPCDTPVKYSIGQIDKRFSLKNQQVIAYANEAASSWNNAYGKELFIYDPSAQLSINMVFDERQQLTDQINLQENTIDDQKSQISPQLAQYNQKVTDYEKKVADYNNLVNNWNTQGGAPPEEYEKLQKEKEGLASEQSQINELSKKLNLSANQINSQIQNLNQNIKTFNRTIVDKPEEGLYDSGENKIYIYFNINKNELVHTLAHELGHARGMNHVSNQNAIMYVQTNNQLTPTADDLAQLEVICAKQGILENLKKNMQAKDLS